MRRDRAGDDAEVVLWGTDFDGRVVLCDPDGRVFGSFRSAESACRTLSRLDPLSLVWIDVRAGGAGWSPGCA